MRRSACGLAAAVLVLLAGCASDGQFSLRRAFSGLTGEPDDPRWEKVKVPRKPDLPAADIAVAERVETLGRRIIAQNTFTGIDPMFFCAGPPIGTDPFVFHRGPEELWISEALVRQCKTEEQLAAVLCSELGQMVAEKRAARRVAAERDSFPEAALPGGAATLAGGLPNDPARDAERAYNEKRQAKTAPVATAADAATAARDLLKGAGFDPVELDRVAPLLKQSSARGVALRTQIGGSAPPPKWDK
jgi:hypothetical protein